MEAPFFRPESTSSAILVPAHYPIQEIPMIRSETLRDEVLEAVPSLQLEADGFQPGAPAQVGFDIQAIDRQACAEMECGACGRIGLDYLPNHRGSEYAGVCECTSCGFEESL
jgi:hypothetical protein